MTKKKVNLIETQFNAVIELIVRVARNKGWSASVRSKDQENFRYANIQIHKSFTKDYNDESVTGSIDIDVIPEKAVKMQIDKTSFYGYGIDALCASIKEELKELSWLKNTVKDPITKESSTNNLIEQLLNRFDRSARQLKRRYNQRPTVEVNDEYDVQDVLHAILKCYFDDVRPEEYSPSYAGASSRIDFLLKKEKIIIEAKYASGKLKDKKIGEQLIIDIKRYETHPDCETLFCFVYDPGGNIQNPTALENDLSGQHGKSNFKVKVIIAPK